MYVSEEAIKMLTTKFHAKLRRESGHAKETSRTSIYDFPSFGNYQLAIPKNKKKLTVYLNAKSRKGKAVEDFLPLTAIIEGRYPNDQHVNPRANLLSEQNAPHLTPKLNELLRITLPLEDLEGLVVQYLETNIGKNESNSSFSNSGIVSVREAPKFPRDPLNRKRAPVSPEEDEQRRKKQAENGALGEVLAKQYEIARLIELSCPNPEAHVDHVALRDIGAGYDIYSVWNGETRCIEVKAGESKVDSFFISSNEVETLTELKEQGWIYLVDLSKKDDLLNCVTTISNAGEKLAPEGVLKPTQFRATLRG